jgi:hypothetical protein
MQGTPLYLEDVRTDLALAISEDHQVRTATLRRLLLAIDAELARQDKHWSEREAELREERELALAMPALTDEIPF